MLLQLGQGGRSKKNGEENVVQYTDQEMIPARNARNARNVVTLAEVMFVTIQRENTLPSKITDYWLLIN
jgi:hypothetical protein